MEHPPNMNTTLNIFPKLAERSPMHRPSRSAALNKRLRPNLVHSELLKKAVVMAGKQFVVTVSETNDMMFIKA